MRLWRRRAELDARLVRLEQRVADVEDTVDLALASDLLDDLAQRVGELSLTVPAQEDLLDLRLHTARVATDLARLAAELQAGQERVAADLGDQIALLDARLDDLTGKGSGDGRKVLRRA